MHGAAEGDGLSSRENGDLIQQPLRLFWNNSPEVIDIVGVLQAMRKEVRALAHDCRANLAWALARNDE